MKMPIGVIKLISFPVSFSTNSGLYGAHACISTIDKIPTSILLIKTVSFKSSALNFQIPFPLTDLSRCSLIPTLQWSDLYLKRI